MRRNEEQIKCQIKMHNPWLFHFNVRQNSLQIKKNKKIKIKKCITNLEEQQKSPNQSSRKKNTIRKKSNWKDL